MVIEGRAWKYGDSVNTDVLFPGKYTYTVTERGDSPATRWKTWTPHLPPTCVPATWSWQGELRPRLEPRAGRHLSRVQRRGERSLPRALAASSIATCSTTGCWRSSARPAQAITAGEPVAVDVAANLIRCAAGEFAFAPLSASVMGIVEAGGLVEYVKRKLAAEFGRLCCRVSERMIDIRSHRLTLAVAHLGYDVLRATVWPIAVGARVMLVKDNSVLLVYHSYLDNWHFPGGGMKRGETLLDAARREAYQEAGVVVTGELRWPGLYTGLSVGRADHTVVFACEDFALQEPTDRWTTRLRLLCLGRSANQHHAWVTARWWRSTGTMDRRARSDR